MWLCFPVYLQSIWVLLNPPGFCQASSSYKVFYVLICCHAVISDCNLFHWPIRHWQKLDNKLVPETRNKPQNRQISLVYAKFKCK